VSDNEPQSYPVVGQAPHDLRCGLYIRKYFFWVWTEHYAFRRI